jgi:hypothetical protein
MVSVSGNAQRFFDVGLNTEGQCGGFFCGHDFINDNLAVDILQCTATSIVAHQRSTYATFYY